MQKCTPKHLWQRTTLAVLLVGLASAGATWNFLPPNPRSVLSFSVTALSPDTRYYYAMEIDGEYLMMQALVDLTC